MENIPPIEGITPSYLWIFLYVAVGICALIILIDKVADVFRRRKQRKELDKPELAYSVAGYAKKCTRQGRICTIEYMSDSVAAANWTQGKLLFTLKAGYRPTITSYVVAAITATPYLALVQVGQDGTVRFYSANGTLSGNPRLYLNFSYSIA